jgi:hypothetical protein
MLGVNKGIGSRHLERTKVWARRRVGYQQALEMNKGVGSRRLERTRVWQEGESAYLVASRGGAAGGGGRKKGKEERDSASAISFARQMATDKPKGTRWELNDGSDQCHHHLLRRLVDLERGG